MIVRNLFIILALLLAFSSVGKDADVIRISFNKKTYVKDVPKTLEEAVATIRSMEYLFNSFDSTYTFLDSTYSSTKKQVDTLSTHVDIYSNKITLLTNNIDSLTNIIIKQTDSINTYTQLYTDSIKFIADILDKTNSAIKFGIGVGLSGGGKGFSLSTLNDYCVTPLITYKNIFTSLNLGVYNSNKEIFNKYGINVGWFLE